MEDRDDQAVVAVEQDEHEVVYDGGGQLVVERKDLEEGVDGGKQVVGEQKDHEEVEGSESGA